ncbi:MAG: acetate--CoA ligase family protein [Candidatus Omnitrophica bacterium]|jgi:acetyltransferase|nr:acetate--CoA ligase family protein [Candidatus Omnitrophota bacterium]
MFQDFFNPSSIVVIGASREPQKVGYAIVKNLIEGNFKGKIYPVNPKADEILEIKCFDSIKNVSETPSLAVIVLPAKIVSQTVEECCQKGIKSLVVISAGFKETGKEGEEREKELLKIANKYNSRIIGPNCLGITDTYSNLNASFGPFMPDKGKIAFISQSGAIICAVIDWAKQEKIGFSRVISIGNMADVSEAELIEDCGNDENTKVILLYMEGVKNGKDFIQRVSKITNKKPVLAIKSGLTVSGSKAVSSHTGSLAGSASAYKAAFEKAGVIQVETLSELFDSALLLISQPIIKGNNIAIVTNAGGASVLATDTTEKLGLKMAQLSESTKTILKENLPSSANIHNPVDVIGDADEKRYAIAIENVLKDENVNGLLTILTPQVMTKHYETAEKLIELSKKFNKTVVSSFIGGTVMEKTLSFLQKNNIPNYSFPETAVNSLKSMVMFNNIKNRKTSVKKDFTVDSQRINEILSIAAKSDNKYLTDFQAREIFTLYNIKKPNTYLAKTLEDAIKNSDSIGFPMVAKIVSPDILHKTEAGGVKVNIKNKEDLEKSYNEIIQSIKKYNPKANIEGIEIQEMVKGVQEVIIGAKKDPQFGHLIMFGLGGIFVELLKDVIFKIIPVTQDEAFQMVSGIKEAKLLTGYRNTPEADIEEIVETILKVSHLCENHPEISEIDLNPLIVKEKGRGLVMVDTRIIIG